MTTTRANTAEAVLVTSMMRAVSNFRWVTVAWAVAGTIIGRAVLVHPVWAAMLLAMAVAMTLYLHRLGRSEPARLSTWPVLTAEVTLGLVLLVADGLVFTDERSQSLPWAWPAAGIAAVGVASAGGEHGWLRRNSAVLVAVLVGVVSLSVEIGLLGRFSEPGQLGAALSKIGLWLLVGLIVGPLMERLLRAERLISVAKAREDLARELHDGVLQTLAVVQRRSGDAELTALARDQENSLRAYLSDARLMNAAVQPVSSGSAEEVAAVAGSLTSVSEGAGLEPALRRVAADAERLHQYTVQVLVAADCPRLAPGTVTALRGAVVEALNNAGRHGRADRVTVFAEPDGTDEDDESVFVSVHDNGSGFVVDDVTEGIGLSRSIKGRISEAGGRVEISSRPGKGTEVRLWL